MAYKEVHAKQESYWTTPDITTVQYLDIMECVVDLKLGNNTGYKMFASLNNGYLDIVKCLADPNMADI